ncbi:MAG: hypothetical protein K2K64_02285 [Muribaculaceae bacterium]|nr:hypothetical protein [Muribaculaceae bacterium]
MSRFLFPLAATLLFLVSAMASCSSDEPAPRDEDDILGVWTDGEGRYLYFISGTDVFDLRLDDADGEKNYTLMQDSYFYEPGYNFVILMDFMKGLEEGNFESTDWEDLVSPEVFQVTTLDKKQLTWCWVDNLTDDKYKGMSKKEIIGRVIMEADKGFTLLPQNYQTFTSVSHDEFQQILIDYDVWELMDDEEEE